MWPTLASATKKLWWTTRTQCVPWCMRWEAAERFFDGSTSILDVIFVAQEWHKEVKWLPTMKISNALEAVHSRKEIAAPSASVSRQQAAVKRFGEWTGRAGTNAPRKR